MKKIDINLYNDLVNKIGTRHINIVSMARTGSTLVYQIINYLFSEILIEKHHHYHNNPATYKSKNIITYRDFRDVLISLYRTILSKNGEIDFSINITKYKHIDNLIKNSICFLNQLSDFNKLKIEYNNNNIKKDNILFLKYEDFYNNYDYIFDNISLFFNYEISFDVRNIMKAMFSVNNNKKIANSMENFSQMDSLSMIHGHHIVNGNIGYWKEVIPKKFHEYYTEKFENSLLLWGYEL